MAEAFRFYKGDAMLVDDWNTAQMNGFLLLPFVYLYMFVVKTTEGIIFFFRILYLIFKVLVTVFCFQKLKKYGVFAIIGISIYYFFSPQTLEALSYNTIPMGMILMIGSVCLAEKRTKVDYYLCGIFLAVAVLSQPFCIIIYFAGMIAVIWKCFTDKDVDKWELVKKWGLVSIGAFTLLALFMAFVFRRASLTDILENLPFILQDKNHNMAGMDGLQSLVRKPAGICRQIVKGYPAITVINTIYIFVLLVTKVFHKENTRFIYGGNLPVFSA